MAYAAPSAQDCQDRRAGLPAVDGRQVRCPTPRQSQCTEFLIIAPRGILAPQPSPRAMGHATVCAGGTGRPTVMGSGGLQCTVPPGPNNLPSSAEKWASVERSDGT